MQRMKKIICLLLALFMALAVFASCNTLPSDPTESNESSEFVSEPEESGSNAQSESSDEPETDGSTEEKDSSDGETESETESDYPVPPEIDYGTIDAPVTTTYAYTVCASLENGESSAAPLYVKGTVTEIGETGKYYKNVYFTDGETEMLIYTINMGDGVSGFEVGDTITAYGYIKNYNGTIEMATYEGSVYVYAVKVESNGGNQGGNGGNTTEHIYADFTTDEKALFNSYFGFVIPFIPNDEYYVEEYEYEGGTFISFYAFGNTQAEFDAYRALFADYTFDGTDEDEYGDTWYYYSKGDVCVDMSFYYYENEYVVDVYVYLSDDDSGNQGGGGSESEINYGTLSNPVSTTYAYTVCANFADGESSVDPFYVKGTVTKIGEAGKYYKNVYFTDGITEMLIYTINMGDGVSGFEVGDTITAYGHIKNYKGTIEMATYNGSVYVYAVKVESNGGNQGGNGSNTTEHIYTDFTTDEKALFNSYFGFVIPFIPNDNYCAEEYTFDTEVGINFYTFGNTQSEFDAYRALFSSYTYDGTDTDDYGDAWYYYSKGDVYVDMSYYYDGESNYIVDVYVYILDENSGENGGNGGSVDPDVNLITNDGKGLPESESGIYDVDFTKGNYVQNVTDQGYYIDGCPTTGSPAVLVIPVDFIDATAASRGYTIANIEKIFSGKEGDTSYYSVYDYFYISSYGKLELDITVVDSWFRPSKDSSYYENATYDYYGDSVAIGDQLILDEALAYLATVMDLSKFDSDNNGMIDAVIMINTLDIGDDDFHWAYRYWNVYTDDEGYYYEYDGVSANDYVWIAYEFMFESYDDSGDVNYDTTNPLNPYTFIHEFSHVLGADDYYDTEYYEEPLGGCDIMDGMTGDHNPYTKFNYGWLTSSRLIVADGSVTVTLDPFAKNGDTVIIANNWDESLGAYQEYYVIMYYTGVELNSGDGGYFLRDGILVYHVNSSLFAEDYEGETYYDVYNTNTSASSQYGTENNLIEFVLSGEGNYTYVEGDSLPTVYDDSGRALCYTFTVDSITAELATLTFTKN